jgi:cytochrome c peroxidase
VLRLLVCVAALSLRMFAALPASAAEAGGYTYGVGAYSGTFRVPEPGSYELPPMGRVGEHPLIVAEGTRTTLATLVENRFAVVSFVYGTCSEANGCPLSNAVLQRLDRLVTADPDLSRRTQILTVSFDPARDTPQRLAAMQRMRAEGSNWRFVTSPGEAALAALLDDFGQTISKLKNADGSATTTYRHVLKVFLLDRERKIRNIYSVGFLDADLLLADLKTLLVERR